MAGSNNRRTTNGLNRLIGINLLSLAEVEAAMFYDDRRVVASHSAQQHLVRIVGCCGHCYPESRNMSVDCLETLGVLRTRSRQVSLLCPDGERSVLGPVRNVTHICRLIDELVECDEREVGPHDFHYRALAAERGTERSAEDRRLRDRSVKHASLAVTFLEALGSTKYSTRFGDVLTEEQRLRELLESSVECGVHC